MNYDSFLGGNVESRLKAMLPETQTKQTLDKYEEYLNSGKIMEHVRFTAREKMDGLYYYDKGDVTVHMANEEIVDMRYAGDLSSSMGREYAVVVTEVDRENRRVEVSFRKAQDKQRPGIIAAINRNLKEGKVFKAAARVMYVYCEGGKNFAFLDIYGLGIRGILLAKVWGVNRTEDLSSVLKRNDIIDVVIKGKTKLSKEGDEQYSCARANDAKVNPWNGLAERFPENRNVIVRCTSKKDHYFLGQVEGAEGITAYCFYPELPGKYSGVHVKVVEQQYYYGHVRRVKEDKMIFRIAIDDYYSENR